MRLLFLTLPPSVQVIRQTTSPTYALRESQDEEGAFGPLFHWISSLASPCSDVNEDACPQIPCFASWVAAPLSLSPLRGCRWRRFFDGWDRPAPAAGPNALGRSNKIQGRTARFCNIWHAANHCYECCFALMAPGCGSDLGAHASLLYLRSAASYNKQN